MEIILLAIILAVQVVTLVVAFVGTNFDVRAWRLPFIGKVVQAVVPKLLKHSK